METIQFEELVQKAVENLPDEFRQQMDNIDVLVADYPTALQLKKGNVKQGYTLLGLYEGVPRTKRTSGYNFVLPDKITIFQKPIEAMCRNDSEVMAEIERVVKHEIAHHFGISDERLRDIGRY